jgi:uracil-DNA glycosylase
MSAIRESHYVHTFLSPQIIACRNRALARRVVAEAAAAGLMLRLSSLLVEPTWNEALAAELGSAHMRQLESFLHAEWASGRKAIFPPKDCIFQAFNACPFNKVRTRPSTLCALW